MIKGSDELQKKLNMLCTEMKEKIVKKAVGKATERVRSEAKLLCPVDKGELRQSIKASVKPVGDNMVGIVYTNKDYAPYVEFGTGPTGEENHAGISPEVTPSYSQQGWSYMGDEGEWIYTNGQAAQPFMYPALKNNEKNAKKIINDSISADIERLV